MSHDGWDGLNNGLESILSFGENSRYAVDESCVKSPLCNADRGRSIAWPARCISRSSGRSPDGSSIVAEEFDDLELDLQGTFFVSRSANRDCGHRLISMNAKKKCRGEVY